MIQIRRTDIRQIQAIYVGVNGQAVKIWDRKERVINSIWYRYFCGEYGYLEAFRETEVQK